MRPRINIAVRCRKELESLQNLLISLQDFNSDVQMYRVAINSGQFKFLENLRPVSVDKWLRKLNMLLQEAFEMIQECKISRYNMISCYITSKNIASMTSITTQLAQSLCHVQQFNIEMVASSSCSSTVPLTERTIYVGEPLVGQDMAFARLEELVWNTSQIGVVGMGGSGKTLFLRRIFNSHRVQDLFGNDLLLWLSVSQNPSFEWEFTLRKLQDAESIKYGDVAYSLYGEGLLERQDQLRVGQTYANLLADRCLIEAIQNNVNDTVLYFRMHDVMSDVLYNLVRQIAVKEENCFFLARRGVQRFPANDCLPHMGISLFSKLGVPRTFTGSHIWFWLVASNLYLQIILRKVIGSMTSL